MGTSSKASRRGKRRRCLNRERQGEGEPAKGRESSREISTKGFLRFFREMFAFFRGLPHQELAVRKPFRVNEIVILSASGISFTSW